jgi:hypothetical protein
MASAKINMNYRYQWRIFGLADAMILDMKWAIGGANIDSRGSSPLTTPHIIVTRASPNCL